MPEDSPPKKRSLLRLLGKIAATLLILIVLLIGTAFLLRDRIGAELKTRLEAQLAERGIHVDYHASDFAPFRGLTLTDLKIYRDASRQATAVTLSEARLRYQLLGILRGQSAAAVQLVTDKAGLVLSDDSGDFAFEDLDTRVSIDRSGTEIHEFSGRFRDIRFQIDGALAWRSREKEPNAEGQTAPSPPTDASRRVIDLSPVLRWLDQVPDTPEGEADLRLTLSRPGYPAPYSLRGRLEGETLKWRGLIAHDALLRFSVDPNDTGGVVVAFPELGLKIAEGSLKTAGSWNSSTNVLTLTSLQTSLNPAELAPVLPEKTGATLPILPPYELIGSGTLPMSDLLGGEFSGTLTCEGPAEIPIPGRPALDVAGLHTAYALKARDLTLTDLAAKLGDGGPVGLRSNIVVRPPAAGGDGLRIDFQDLILTHGEGSLTTTGSLDAANNTIALHNLDASVDPASLLVALGFDDPLSPHVRFPDGPPHLVMAGRISLNSVFPTSKLTGTFAAPHGAEVPAGGEKVARLTDLTTGFTLENGRLDLSELVTGVFDGKISLPALALDLTASPVTFDGALRLEALDLESITSFLDAEKRRTGKISGHFTGNGSPDLATLTGSGEIEIAGAEFGTVPIFRTLRPLLSAITLSNWRGETEGATLSSVFTFEEGVMHSDDISLVGDFYEVHALAKVDFPNRRLMADGYVSTSGATKVLTQVVGKALEVEAEGAFDDFSWKLKNAPGIGTVSDLTGLSKDLLGKTLGAAASGEIAGAVLNGVKDTLSNGGKPVRGAANLAEDALKGVAGAGKKLFGLGKKKEEAPEPEKTGEVPESRE